MDNELKVFTITENGFSMDGSGNVSVPACRIKANGYIEASQILTTFLETKVKPDSMELITPMEKINFD